LNSFFNRSGTKAKLKEVTKEFWEELADRDSDFSRGFMKAVGVNEVKKAKIVFDFLLKLGESTHIDLVTRKNIDDVLDQANSELSDEDCQTAIEFLQYMSCVGIDGEDIQPESILRKISPSV